MPRKNENNRVARASALLRQRGYLVVEPNVVRSSQRLIVGPLTLDLEHSQLMYGTSEIALSPVKFLIVQALMEAEGGWCSRRSLRKLIWGEDVPASDPLPVHIHHLRKDIVSLAGVDLLESSRRRGHRLAFDHFEGSDEE